MQVFTSVLVLGAFFAVFIISDIESYKKRKVESMNSLAHIIATNTISTLQFQDSETASDILAELKTISPEIVHAVIYNNEGALFASYTKAGVDTASISTLKTQGVTHFSGNRLFVVNSIEDENKQLGSLRMQVELSELAAIKAERYKLVTILLFGAIGFSFLVALAVQTYISRRLLRLVNRMGELRATGKYSAVQDDGKDEISVLIQEFNKLMQEVKESGQKKDEFIGIASHELKTPLTSVKGYLDLLSTIEDNSTHKQFLQKSLESVDKLERLIKDLLDVSKIQSGQLQLNLNPFNIEELLKETVDSFGLVASTHQLILHNELSGEMIYGDRHKIEQVLVNLLSNAVKYSPGQSRVLINSKKEDDYICIQVRDFGIGVAPEELSRIFDRFYRTEKMVKNISGFGLGLYICRNIIERHHGKIWAQLEEQGASFVISLPVTATPSLHATQAGGSVNQ